MDKLCELESSLLSDAIEINVGRRVWGGGNFSV
jgi:hypothetical protein